ncbi:MAG: TetR/AcrR family transcriptional regulator [Bacilli bacterium]|nr:TetR/AcrR family transcriptional regulator [Bacilli bacterium]
MDRRIIRTTNAVYHAFSDYLKNGTFEEMTVEDLLQGANLSRSTFYAHFKTKGSVLDSLIDSIFRHVFSETLTEEKSHDFSASDHEDSLHFYVHVLFHFKDLQDLIAPILSSDCRDRFLSGIRKNIDPITQQCLHSGAFAKRDVPEKFLRQQITESYLVLICHWFSYQCQKSPEEMMGLFCALWC